MIQNPVESFFSGVLVAAPRGRDTSPSRRGFDAEFQWVRRLIRPRHGNRFKIPRSQQMQILDRTASAQGGDFLGHADLVLVVGHDLAPPRVGPTAVLFSENLVAQGSAQQDSLIGFGDGALGGGFDADGFAEA